MHKNGGIQHIVNLSFVEINLTQDRKLVNSSRKLQLCAA
ncbi:hypothetical protein SAMN05444267_101442 [Chryseobacterium polytrichastri]|uniref:Uncharacterized protein n=1 Tax=Chryseobacterium polytrichastri TaxID=1302687 RepID=A0A1M6YX92_9FLAO|nr:hypothetical protein SAMN05444267_101442 [Chryseobacterium polytrichastri]